MYAHLCTGAEYYEWKAAFQKNDRRGKGEILTQEVGLLLRSLRCGFTNHELVRMVAMADVDRNGSVDFEEFTGLMVWWKRRRQIDGLLLSKCRSRYLRLLQRIRSGEANLVLEAHDAPPDERMVARAAAKARRAAKEAAAAAAAAASASGGDGAPPDVLPIRPPSRSSARSSRSSSPKAMRRVNFAGGADGSSGDGDEEEDDDDQIEEERAVPVTIEEERWELLSVLDELWVNRTMRSLNLQQLVSNYSGEILDEFILGEMCRALSYATTLQLTELNLSGLELGDRESIEPLAEMLRHNTSLRTLQLNGCGIGPDGARILLDALRGEGGNCTLRSLVLKGNEDLIGQSVLTEISEQLRDNIAKETLRLAPTHTPRLLLAGHNINGSHMEQLREHLVARTLPSGGSDSRSSSPEGQRPGSGRRKSSVGLTPKNQVVQSLDLSANSTCGDSAALTLMCRGGQTSSLGEVLTDDLLNTMPLVAQAIAREPDEPLSIALSRLHTLCLRRCGVTNHGIAALSLSLHCKALPNLIQLDLRENRIGQAPSPSPSQQQLQLLSALPEVTASDEDASTRRIVAAFGSACALQGLESLRLDGNLTLLDEPASLLLHSLLQAHHAPSQLTLSGCGVGDEAARAVSSALIAGAPLDQLLLGDFVGDAGAAHLAEALGNGCALRELALGTRIGDAGVSALAGALGSRAGEGCHLELLCLGGQYAGTNVRNPNITASSMADLSKALSLNVTLRTLWMQEVSLGDEGCASLMKGLARNLTLTKLDLSFCGADELAHAALRRSLRANWALLEVFLRAKEPPAPELPTYRDDPLLGPKRAKSPPPGGGPKSSTGGGGGGVSSRRRRP